MLSPRWRKILGDLWSYKTRTVVVILSIAVGVFAVGMIAGTQVILTRDMQASYLAIDPPAAILGVSAFDDDLVEAIGRMPQVDEAEGHGGLSVRLSIGPDTWRTLHIAAFPDYNHIRVNKITSERGAWPPPKHEILIERSSLSLTNAQIGDSVMVELPNGTQRSIRIAGTAHNINMPPAAFTGWVDGFVTFDTLEWLGGSRDYFALFLTLNDKTLDRDGVGKVINLVRDKIERGGYDVNFAYVPIPGKHPADSAMQPMLLILGVLGAMSLLLSGFLVVNTISALLTQQVRQIGVMKSIGANTRQIVAMYLATVLIYGLLALLIAVPLGGLGAYAFTKYLAELINFDVIDYTTPPHVLALEVGAGLVVPLLAALWPVLGGARVTVREAISSYGLGRGRFGRGWIDRLLERVRFLSRPLLLSLRNTFRRKGRLVLTLSTLTLGGAIFIGVFSVRDGLFLTAEQKIFTFWRHDLFAFFDRPYSAELLAQEARKVPGVVRLEPVAYTGMRRLRPDGNQSDDIGLIGTRNDNDLINATVLSGRWIVPGDQNAIVISTDTLRNETDLKVGDDVVLKYGDRELTWRIVGIYQGGLAPPRAIVSYDYLANITRRPGRASWIQVVTSQHDQATRDRVVRELNEHFKAIGIHMSGSETIDDVRRNVGSQFGVIVNFLMIMAVLLAVVGGLGLMGTMSINVLERTREIGVLRAIGASNGAVLRIVIVEGVLIGALSWAIGALLALPLSLLLSDAVGVAFLQMPLDFVFSLPGLLIWLGVVAILAALASLLPAWNAARLTVRDVLAYEG
ncbi:MAG TPA: FtsX-like permease family protein [Roseiflexaceae bacterium]|nr:FtsX-like permease family protein [Roseiflexaceae bacterium]